MLALKRLPEKHTLAAQTSKRTQILIQTGRGKRQGGTNNDMCSASASGNTVLINLHYIPYPDWELTWLQVWSPVSCSTVPPTAIFVGAKCLRSDSLVKMMSYVCVCVSSL